MTGVSCTAPASSRPVITFYSISLLAPHCTQTPQGGLQAPPTCPPLQLNLAQQLNSSTHPGCCCATASPAASAAAPCTSCCPKGTSRCRRPHLPQLRQRTPPAAPPRSSGGDDGLGGTSARLDGPIQGGTVPVVTAHKQASAQSHRPCEVGGGCLVGLCEGDAVDAQQAPARHCLLPKPGA
mmetsp:Transcript_30975/g.68652  ORF Transcript_30975/g.68652 Transcript_30975/m.68652 type:complete len:181 (+) Transcript_30975:232-774(+)